MHLPNGNFGRMEADHGAFRITLLTKKPVISCQNNFINNLLLISIIIQSKWRMICFFFIYQLKKKKFFDLQAFYINFKLILLKIYWYIYDIIVITQCLLTKFIYLFIFFFNAPINYKMQKN